ncbi:MAG: DUF1804 family protein [Chromatiales bacterium]|nr:DUF1804 family protein [Chromatiales bacterium]
MAHSEEVRRRARAYYVHERLSLEAAAAKAGIGHVTIARWKREALKRNDDWDRARAASSISAEGLKSVAQVVLEDYLIQHKAALDELRDLDAAAARAAAEGREHAPTITPLQRAEVLSRLSDSFHKALAAHAKLQPELSRLAVAMDVMKLQARFIREHYPQHAAVFLEIIEPFGEELSRAYA